MVDAGEGAADREALALEAARRGGDGHDGAGRRRGSTSSFGSEEGSACRAVMAGMWFSRICRNQNSCGRNNGTLSRTVLFPGDAGAQ